MQRGPLKAAGVALIVLFTATAASGATPMRPYRITPTRTCLKHRGAHLMPRSDRKLEPNQLEWVLPHSGPGTKAKTIVMRFLRSPAKATAYEQITRHTFVVIGFDDAWIRRHLTRRQNVVIEKDNVSYALTKRQLATISGCLRR